MARSIQLGKFKGGLSRIQQQIKQNLGVISADEMNKVRKFRNADLDKFDAYYENRQYDDKLEWEEALHQDEYIPIRSRKPRIIYNLAKVLTDKVAAKLVGNAVFPQLTIEDDPDDTSFIRAVMKMAGLKANIMDPVKGMLRSGSAFIRFYIVEGTLRMEWAESKYCYPVFDAKGELESIEIKYVFEDENDKDARGKPKQKWYRLELTQTVDTLYDNPEFRDGSEPNFEPVEVTEHNLGWVQGEWIRTTKSKFSPDGTSIYKDILGFIDDMNYSLSQTSQAVGYGQEPQLGVSGMDEDEIDRLIKSSQKAWNLGREGKAEFIETALEGVKQATESRDNNRNRMLEVVRVVLHDPEKMSGHAQSGAALEILHTPLVELVDELRLVMEPALKNLVIKMGMTLLEVGARGEEIELEVPAGYMPSSLDISIHWPALFPVTLEDLQKKVAAAAQATAASVISRETATRWLAKDFGVEDIDEELSKIASQPQLNPFGTFGGP